MELTAKKKKAIFTVILISTAMSSMLQTALTTALPAIMVDFDISATTGQWLTSIYSLVMGVVMLCTAFLANRFPTRKLYITALVIFICGLAVDVFAPGFAVMMGGRVLQACGNGILASMGQMILLSIYPPEQRGSVMGIYGLGLAAAPIVAPTIAGLIVDYLGGWRMIFVLVGIVCICSLLGAIFSLSDLLENRRIRLDMPSVLLCTLAFTCITLGVGNLDSSSLLSFKVGGLIVIAVLSAFLFSRRQLNTDQPFLNIRIFRNREFLYAVIGSVLLYLVMFGVAILYPMQMQTLCGYSATVSALIYMPGSLTNSLSNPFIGKMYNRMGMKKMLIIGAVMTLQFNVVFCFATETTPLLLISVINAIRCLGIGFLSMPLITYSITTLENKDIPSASSLLNALRTVAGSIGSAIFVAFAALGSKGALNMAGMRFSHLTMAVCTAVLLLFGIFVVRKKAD